MTETGIAGGKEHGLYHHGDLAGALLEVAIREIGAHGTEKLSLRALAREAGVSSTAPYRHFRNKAALLAALAVRGFSELTQTMAAADSAADPRERLLATGEAYLDYALAHTVEYQLMFGEVIGDFTDYRGLREAAEKAYALPLSIIDAGMEQGLFRRAEPVAHGAVIWSALHGMSSLLINFASKTEQADSMALRSVAYLREHRREMLEVLLRGIATPGS